MTLLESTLAWAAHAVHPAATVVEVRALRGDGPPWALQIDHPEVGAVDTVLRAAARGARADVLTEHAALTLAARHGLPVPRLLAADLQGETYALLLEMLPGSTTIPLEPSTARLHAIGAMVAAFHRVELTPGPHLPLRARHMPWIDLAHERRAGRSPSTPLLDDADRAMSRADSPVADTVTVFVHGDLWQGQYVWMGEVLSGIIDWEAAGAGSYGVDLGALRFDAALLHGDIDPADEIVAGWESESGRPAENIAYWDIVAALNTTPEMTGSWPSSFRDAGRPDLDAAILTARRDAFLENALTRLDI